MKRILSVVLVMLLCIGLIPNTASAAIKISQKSASVIKGDYLYLSIEGTKKKATWTSSNKRVATVSKTGKVVSISKGKATITAKVDGEKYSCKVTVIPKLDPDYMTDTELKLALAERNAIEALTSKDPSDATPAKSKPKSKPKTSSSDRNLDGITYYQDGKTDDTSTESEEIITEHPEWVGNFYLQNACDLTASWLGEKIYLAEVFGDGYTITGSPKSKFESGKVYEGQYNNYTVRFKYDEEILFYREDLKSAGIIKTEK